MLRRSWPYPALVGVLLASAAGCSDDETVTPPSGTGGQGGDGGGGHPPVTDPCAPDEVPVGDGTCMRPGIPAGACGEGFVAQDDGCQPVLPASDCEPGTMAIPGETTCREVAPCGQGTWGDITVEAGDEHVDGAYSGGASDGSAAHPWTTIQAAVTAAAPGDTIAIAAGQYVEDVFIHQRSGLTLWGRCPSMVSLSGLNGTDQSAAIFLTDEAPDTTLRGLAITGPKKGVYTIALGTVLDQVWIHDTAEQGIFAIDGWGPSAELTMRDSLVEETHRTAIFVAGSAAIIEGSVIRDTQGDGDGLFGRGVYLDRTTLDAGTEETTSATLELRRSLLQRNRMEALRIDGGDATVEDSVIVDTLGETQTDGPGVGLSMVWHAETGARPSATVARTTITRSRADGLLIVGADLTMDAVVVEDTAPLATGRYGRGMEVQGHVEPSVVLVTRSLIQGNTGAGVLAGAADVTLDETILRDHQPEPTGDLAGRFGFGATAQASPDWTQPGTLTVSRCLVVDNHVAGVSVLAGSLTVSASRIDRTAESPDEFGDGVLVYNYFGVPSSGHVEGTLIGDNVRAGVAAFGATVTLADSLVACNAVDLNGEVTFDAPFQMVDQGGNACGCGTLGACQTTSSALVPPDPL